MPWFRYEAADKTGKRMTGAMSAPDESAIRQRLVSSGYTIVSVALAVPAQVTAQTSAGKTERSALTAPSSEMGIFFRELATMLHGGIHLYESLAHISDQSRNRHLQQIALRLASAVQAGEKLSIAMEEFPRAFPAHVRGVVASGELGGFLPLVIGDVALDYEIAMKASSRAAKIWSFLIWINVAFTVMFFPSGPLIVKGVKALEAGSVPTDIGARIFIVLKPFLNFTLLYSIPITVGLVAAWYFVSHWLGLPQNRYLYYQKLLRVPWTGRASRERSLATFSRILWRLQSAGVLPIQSWEAASKAPENLYIADILGAQTDKIRGGVRFSDALISTGLFSPDDQRILTTAEKAGRITESLQRLSSYYEDAAMVSANRAKWLGIRIGIIALIVSSGLLMIISASSYGGLLTMFSGISGDLP